VLHGAVWSATRRVSERHDDECALAPAGGGLWHDPAMQHAFGMAIPETVAEMCRPGRVAVLVYDAQVGIVAHIRDRDLVLKRIASVVEAARGVGVPVFYVRHVSVPPSHMGIGALRTAMAWQRVERPKTCGRPSRRTPVMCNWSKSSNRGPVSRCSTSSACRRS